jgi:hypothetical protein
MRGAIRRFARFLPILPFAAVLLFPTTAAAAASASIQPQSAVLVARGAEVDVSVVFTCPAGDFVGNPYGMPGGATAILQQAISKSQQASGSGFTAGQICTGQPQTAVIQVVATVPGPPFRTGPALATAYMSACNTLGNCVFASSASTTIRVTK